MDFLIHIRKDFCPGMDTGQFAAGVVAMHGFPVPISKEMIADLEDVYSENRYPRPILEEVALYCTRVASKEHSRLIELEDIVSFKERALSADESIGWKDPTVAALQEATEEATEDTSPALPIGG